MVLQREPHLKNGIMTRCRQFPKRRYEFSKRHGVREGIHGCLMHRPQAVGELDGQCVDLAAKRDNTGEIAHRFPRSLPRPIRHRRAYQDVSLACPPGERDLKRGQQRAEERCASDAGQFPRGVGQIGRKL